MKRRPGGVDTPRAAFRSGSPPLYGGDRSGAPAMMSRAVGKVRTAIRVLSAPFLTLISASPPLQYYSPPFLNLEKSHAPRSRVGRKFPILGPSAAVAKQIDPLYKLRLRPGHVSLHDDSYKNPVLLSEYVTEMGKIMGRKNTELTRRSQREVGKAIRRARSMGLMPVMSKNVIAWKRYRN